MRRKLNIAMKKTRSYEHENKVKIKLLRVKGNGD